jgi:hypothetical protein
MRKPIAWSLASCLMRAWIVAWALSLHTAASAFDVTTHAAMTSEALAASQITRDPTASVILRRLGVVDLPVTSELLDRSLGKNYVYQGAVPSAATGMPVEARVMGRIRDPQTGLQVAGDFSVSGWFMRGAIREDDNTSETPNADDPSGVFDRVFGHFFDPVGNRGLSLSVLPTQPRAVDWATSSAARVNPIVGLPRANQFKVSDAREAMWRALTLKTGALSDDVVPSGWNNLPSTREATRKAYWATTFRALGDVVHLLQDMAQPQHTRNDAHSGRMCVPGVGCVGGHASFFENYLAARTITEPSFSLEEGLSGIVLSSLQVNIKPDQLSYETSPAYPTPRFLSYADYFAKGSNAEGHGLANYSNRGFYSFGTNINNPASATYPAPSPTGSGLGFTTVTTGLTDRFGKPVTGSVTFRTGTVQDSVDAARTESNVKLAATGLFDQFLTERNSSWSRYTLNYINYNEQARLLVPRAVAYSAGLIDYFFRGQLYVAPPAEGVYALLDHGDPASNCKDTCGFTKLKVKVANATPDITPPGGPATPQTMGNGMLVAVAKFRRNRCYSTDLSGEYAGAPDPALQASYYEYCVGSQPEEIVVSDPSLNTTLPPCNAGQGGNCDTAAVPLTLTFSQTPASNIIPVNAASLSIQIIFRGPLGSEADAVVVETVDVSEPTYLTYMNSSDYIKIGASVYTRERINSDPAQPDDRPSAASLRQAVQPQSCIVNDQLNGSCFQPFDVSFPLKWGSPVTDTVVAPLTLAQPGKFSRFAMLVPPSLAGTVSQALSPCTPRDNVPVPGQLMQERLVPDPSQPPQAGQPPKYMLQYAVMPISTVRGVNTGVGVYCVALGDGVAQAPSSTELRWMANVTGPDLTPVPVTGFSFGP